MKNIDELAEGYYRDRDPQYQSDDETEEEIKEKLEWEISSTFEDVRSEVLEVEYLMKNIEKLADELYKYSSAVELDSAEVLEKIEKIERMIKNYD